MFLTEYHKLLLEENREREKSLSVIRNEFEMITYKSKNNEHIINNSLRFIRECMYVVNEDYKSTMPLSVKVTQNIEWGDLQFEEKLQKLREADGKESRKLLNGWVNKTFNLALKEVGEVQLVKDKLYEFIMNGGFEQLSIFDKELTSDVF